MAIRAVYWLASYPKSGNTWVRAFLDAYHRGRLDLNRMSLVRSDVFPYFYQQAAPVPLSEMTPPQAIYLRHAALLHASASSIEYATLLKTHHARCAVNQIELIPGGMTESAVYLVRDPRDVVVSFAHHMGKSIDETIDLMIARDTFLLDTETADNPLGHQLLSWSDHVRTWRSAPFRVEVIKYEDLLANPRRELGRALDCFGCEVDGGRVDKAIEKTRFAKLRHLEVKDGFREASKHGRFFRAGESGGWRGVLSDRQLSRISEGFGDEMSRLGYTS